MTFDQIMKVTKFWSKSYWLIWNSETVHELAAGGMTNFLTKKSYFDGNENNAELVIKIFLKENMKKRQIVVHKSEKETRISRDPLLLNWIEIPSLINGQLLENVAHENSCVIQVEPPIVSSSTSFLSLPSKKSNNIPGEVSERDLFSDLNSET